MAARRRAQHGVTEARPRGSVRLLRDPVVGPFFAGRVVATAGVWAHNITAAIVVFQLTRSATLVAAVSVAMFAPQLMLAPWSGARADRLDRRRQLIAGRLITAAGSGALAASMAAVDLVGVTGAAVVIAAAFVVGVGFAVGGPAMDSLLPSLVRPSEVPAIVTLNTLPPTMARATGPVLGALLATVAGPALAFAGAALAQLAFAFVIMAVIRNPVRVPVTDLSLRSGLRRCRTDPALSALLVGVAAIGLGAEPAMTLAPSIARDLGAGQEAVGALASSFGIGATVAFLFLTAGRVLLGLPRLAFVGLLQLGLASGCLAASTSVRMSLLCLAVAGFGMTIALTSMTALIQQRSPERLRGRIMALWGVAFLGSRPAAAVVYGAVADVFTLEIALLGGAATVCACAWVARPCKTDPPGGIPPDDDPTVPREQYSADGLALPCPPAATHSDRGVGNSLLRDDRQEGVVLVPRQLEHAESVTIARPASELYAMVADVTRMPEWSPEVVHCAWDAGHAPGVGATFTGRNQLPDRTWETRCTVIVAEPGREFAFLVNGGRVRWHYGFEPHGESSTRVTETWTFLEAGLSFFRDKHGDEAERKIRERTELARTGISQTLSALKHAAEGS